MILAI
jgi:hypothetical protein